MYLTYADIPPPMVAEKYRSSVHNDCRDNPRARQSGLGVEKPPHCLLGEINLTREIVALFAEDVRVTLHAGRQVVQLGHDFGLLARCRCPAALTSAVDRCE